MKKFVLKKNKEVYSLEELANKEIKATTKIKYEGSEDWTTASEFPELQELIALNNTYNDIRTATSYKRFKPNDVIYIGYVLLLIQLLVPVDRKHDEQNLFSISFTELSIEKIAAYGFVAFITLSFYAYRYLSHRYYRLVKIREQNNSGGKAYYQIQTCVSFTSNVDKLDKENLKWEAREFPKTIPEKKKAKISFDQLTADKIVTEEVLTEVKKRNKKPTFIEKIKHANSTAYYTFFQHHLYSDTNSFFMFCGTLVIGVLYTFFEYFNTLQADLQQQLGMYILGGFVLSYVFIKLYMRPYNCYARVIKRDTIQGKLDDTAYKIQYVISKKNASEIIESTDAKWRDQLFTKRINSRKYGNMDKVTSESELMTLFHKKTNYITGLTLETID